MNGQRTLVTRDADPTAEPRQGEDLSPQPRLPSQVPGSPLRLERRIGILALVRQTLWGELAHTKTIFRDAFNNGTGDAPPTWKAAIRVHASKQDMLRSLRYAEEEYVVLSPRPELIWDSHLIRRIENEITDFEQLGIPWFCLSADGLATDGRQYCAAFFNNNPTLVPDRGRHLIVQSAGTIYVIKISAFHGLGLQRMVPSDPVPFINHLTVIAYGRGFGSFFTSGLFPCLREYQSPSYVGLDEQLSSLNPAALLVAADACELFPPQVPRRDLVTEWVATLLSVLTVKHRVSFVIRTLFRRKHLLNRCLISIEYLRLALGTEVEVILASDVDQSIIQPAATEISRDFPNLQFVIADGRTGEGYSRVRNLVAGLKASTGTRVCIIDDDDYYTPEAVISFAQACEFGTEQLVIFDTQIIVEKWSAAAAKHHREVISFGNFYPAKHWANTLRGSNSIPLCGIIHPGWFVRKVAYEYLYDFDLSEDFVFHLMCLAHPQRPSIKVVESIGAHQSHRCNDDNVSNVEDLTGWMLDTGNGLYQYLFEQERTFDVVALAEAAADGHNAHRKKVALETELARANYARLQATEALARLLKSTIGRES